LEVGFAKWQADILEDMKIIFVEEVDVVIESCSPFRPALRIIKSWRITARFGWFGGSLRNKASSIKILNGMVRLLIIKI
jgi:hypothetical protein